MNQEQHVPNQEEIDELILRISAECQAALLTIFGKHAADANRFQIPFPVITYFISDATASAVYEIIKHSSGDHDVEDPKVLTETELEFAKIIKMQMDEAWAARIKFFSDQKTMDESVRQDGTSILQQPKLH